MKLERHGNTLLHKLVLFLEDDRCCDVAKLLLFNGCAVDALNGQNKTPLFHAVALGKLKTATLLLNMGASVGACDCYGNTPLFFAMVPSLAQLLVARGASVNVKNNDAMTPAHVASALGLWDTLAYLRAAGAKESRNRNGDKPSALFGICVKGEDFVCCPFAGADAAGAETGGLVLPTALAQSRSGESAARVASAAHMARNAVKNVTKTLEAAGETLVKKLNETEIA